MAKSCYLRPVDDKYKSDITLEDMNPVTLGRGPQTGIKNTFCARNQVMLKAMFKEQKVQVKQLGRNPCTIDGKPLAQGSVTYLFHDHKLSLLQGHHSYVLHFNPPPGKIVKLTNELSDSDEESAEPLTKAARIEKILNAQTGSWEEHDSDLLIYKPHKILYRSRIAAYDLDQTLICPKSKGVFPKSSSDWKIIYNEVIDTLAKEIEAGYRIVVFSNQASLVHTKAVLEFKTKIEQIVEKIHLPIEVYLARGCNSKYRKPCTGMWEVMESRNDKCRINRAESFYCGDAAGRVEGNIKYKGVLLKRSADHSQCDYYFAHNVGVEFFTPEEHFLLIKDERQKNLTVFNPAKLPMDVPLCNEAKEITSPAQELVLMVGAPATGKTRFCLNHMLPAGYERINRDELASMEKCYKLTENYLKAGKHVVVDNTNSTSDARQRFLVIARKLKIPCRAFIMNTKRDHALHNNKFRTLVDKANVISDVIVAKFFKNLVLPLRSEGFADIVYVNFWPIFANKQHEKIYNMVLLEK